MTKEAEIISNITEQTGIGWRRDLRIVPFLAILYTLCFLDRSSIGHARLYGLEASLSLTPAEYGWTLSIFFVGYVLFEIPSNLMMKRVSPPVWICRIMVSWGIATIALAAATNYTWFMVGRFFLGVTEAGLFPGILFYMGFWYTREEQGMRIAFLVSSSQVAGSLGGLIAYAVGNIDGHFGLRGWQWIFIVEGIPTVLFGIMTWFVLPSTPQKAYWLGEEQRELLLSKLQESHVDLDVENFDRGQLLEAFYDPKMYMYAFIYLCLELPMYSMALFMPTLINQMGFTSIMTTMLLTVPPCAVAFVAAMLMAWSSDRRMERSGHLILGFVISAAGFIMLILVSPTQVYFRYLAVILVTAGLACCFPPFLSWSNNNMMGSTKAAVASAFIVAIGNIGGFISGQLYSSSDAPNYTLSHTINLVAIIIAILGTVALRFFLSRDNSKLEKLVNRNPKKDESINTTSDPSTFRYVL